MSANAIDLTTLPLVKSWLAANGTAPTNTSDDANIQACITAWSAVFLRETGMGPMDGSAPTKSIFNSQIDFTEVYDGNGSNKLFLRHRPIVSVQSLILGTTAVVQSSGWGQAGFVINSDGLSLSLRSGSGGFSSLSGFYSGSTSSFWKGVQNIQVIYTAGYAATPFDIELAARKTAALNYRRKDWIGLANTSLGQGAGSTTYRDWIVDPDVARLITDYTRFAITP